MKTYLLLTAALLAAPAALWAADATSPEAKLREALKNTMLQNRSLQTERDTLQAAKDQAEADKKDLSDKLEAATKAAAAEQQAAGKVLGETRTKLADQELESAKLRESLEKWKAAQKEAADLAAAKEAARAKLAAEKIELQRHVDDQRVKNQAMYKLGTEVLSRYEKFGLGTAITAREPFTGATRVKMENLVQDYADKLADQRIKPEPAKAKP